MRFRFWKKEEPKDSEKERLLSLRSVLLEASYHMRVFDKVSTRYFALTTDSAKMKNLLWDLTGKCVMDYGKIWEEIAAIEETLHKKYHLDFMNAGHLEDLRIDLINTNIRRADYDGYLPTVQQGQPAAN